MQPYGQMCVVQFIFAMNEKDKIKAKEILRPLIQKFIREGWSDADYIARQITDDLVREGLFKQYDEHTFPIMQVTMQTMIEKFAQELLRTEY